MNATELLSALTRSGITLSVKDGRIGYPAETPMELRAAIKANKPELLSILADGDGSDEPPDWIHDAEAVPPGTLSTSFDLLIDPHELTPCAKCGSLEQWQSLAGNWRCQRCDPPTVADRLRKPQKCSANEARHARMNVLAARARDPNPGTEPARRQMSFFSDHIHSEDVSHGQCFQRPFRQPSYPVH